MSGRFIRIALASAVVALTCTSSAPASDGTWNRAWGKDVDSSVAGAGAEICLVAANCQPGVGGGLGGELDRPFGIGVGPSGDVYVADTNNYRIEEFTAQGAFVRTWGKDVDSVQPTTGFEVCTVAANCQAGLPGTQAGEFDFPEEVGTDAAGNVYVTDFGNNRLQKFSSSGSFLSAWGKNVDSAPGSGYEVCTVAANCQSGSQGGLGGEFYSPTGVAVDAAGNVYVADRDNARIQKFTTDGAFLRTWGKDVDSVQAGTDAEICTVAANCKAGGGAGLGGEVRAPQGVAVDAAGNVYVADENNYRVDKFDSSGNFVLAWGKNVSFLQSQNHFEICTEASDCQQGDHSGILGGEFSDPYGIAVDGDGAVYVADSSNNRVEKFDGDGNFLRTWGDDVDSVQPGAGFEICTVSANCQNGLAGGLGGEFSNAIGVAADEAGDVYVLVYDNERVEKFTASSPDTTPPETTIDSGPAGVTNDSSPTFGFSSNEAGSRFVCAVDFGPFDPCSGPGETHTAGVLADGPHTFSVRAIDFAGNLDPSPAVRTFTVDTVAPETKITKRPKNKSPKPKAKFKFVANETGATFECSLKGKGLAAKVKQFGPCTSPKKYKNLDPGKYRFQVRATDRAGNLDRTPAKDKFKIVE